MEAAVTARGRAYTCPECKRAVILKRGPIRIAHFAHKPPTDCAWARGESLAHLAAKLLLREAFAARGLRAEVEQVVPALPGDRRADVMVWSPSGIPVALELQHATLRLDEITRRAFSYAREGVAQIWLPFLRPTAWVGADPDGSEGDLFLARYPAKPFERWVQGFDRDGLWFYDPDQGALWRGRLAPHRIRVEGFRWYDRAGEQKRAGGFHRWSKRWRELTLWGPYAPAKVRIEIGRREARNEGPYEWPAGRVGRFVVEG